MRIPKRFAAVAALAMSGALALAACGGGGSSSDDGNGAATPSLDDCVERPNDCNSGERGEGGEIIFLVNQGHDSVYNHLRPEGGSVYLIQMMAGIQVGVGEFKPNGEWVWNMDVFASEPELVNENPMTVVYQIRDEAVWTDGTDTYPINIDDALWHWYHMSGKEEHCIGCSPRSTNLHDTVESITASDDGKTITVTFEKDFASPEWFARDLFTYPAWRAEQEGFDWRTPEGMGESSEFFMRNAPDWSNGPYLVERWVPDETMVMVPNPHWYGEVKPTMERIIKQVVPDQSSWATAIATGELHGGAPASFTTDIRDQLAEIDGVMTAIGSAGAVWEHVDMNMESLSDPVLRQAIFIAIDRADAHARIWGDVAPPLRNNHIFAQMSPYYEDHVTIHGYGSGDADRARQMLTEAGYTGAEKGGTLTDPDGNPIPPLRFAYLQGNQNRAQFTELTISYLEEIGITVEPEATPAEQLGTVLAEADFDMVIFGWSGSPLFSTSPFQFYYSDSGSNFGGLKNDEIDELVSQIRNQTDIKVSADLVNQMMPILAEEAFVLPLWDTPNFMFLLDQYVNIRDNHSSSNRSFYNVEDWGVAAVN